MAVPKRRHSKARKNKRRSHHGLPRPTLVRCPTCTQRVLPHTVCANCGKYRGKTIVKIEEFSE